MISGTACIVAAFLLLFPESGKANNLGRLQLLNERIDSLEVEKQVRKRSGQSLSDLEAETALLRDSIGAVRRELQQPAHPADARSSPDQRILKHVPDFENFHFFDWLLVGVGVFVVLSGIVLLLIFMAVFSRRRIRNRKTRPEQPGPAKQPDLAWKNRQAHSAYAKQSATIAEGDSISEKRAEKGVPPPTTAASLAPSLRKGPAVSLQDLIILDNQKGLSVKEISRRHQISTDEVALILKMAKKQ